MGRFGNSEKDWHKGLTSKAYCVILLLSQHSRDLTPPYQIHPLGYVVTLFTQLEIMKMTANTTAPTPTPASNGTTPSASTKTIQTRNRTDSPGYLAMKKLAELGYIDWTRESIIVVKTQNGKLIDPAPIKLEAFVRLSSYDCKRVAVEFNAEAKEKLTKIGNFKRAYEAALMDGEEGKELAGLLKAKLIALGEEVA